MRPERNAAAIAEHEKVDIRLHTIIYNVTDEIKKAMAGLLDPIFKEVRGRAARGPRHLQGAARSAPSPAAGQRRQHHAQGDTQVRLIRDDVGGLQRQDRRSLRRFKDDVGEVKTGFECGISLAGYNDIKVGDVIEVFQMERVATPA